MNLFTSVRMKNIHQGHEDSRRFFFVFLRDLRGQMYFQETQ